MTRIAFICLGSYHIKNWTKEQNFDRQSVYSIALEQAINVANLKETKDKKLECNFFIVENTVSDESQVIEELKSQFSNPLIKDVQYINNNDLGSKNKGAGEYMMCRAVIEKHKEELSTYDWIIYYTLRQIIVAPIVLKAIYESNLLEENIPSVIVGAVSSMYADGKNVTPPSNNYCDMIFAMRPKQFLNYVESMTPEELTKRKMSSEENLYNFIEVGKNNGSIMVKNLKRMGVMRYDNVINKTEIS